VCFLVTVDRGGILVVFVTSELRCSNGLCKVVK
jgi:hypothetical protein